MGVTLSTNDDLIIIDKFIDSNIKEHEIIGGQSVFVLLDVRQDE
jgi:hypothetical protein